MKAQRGTNSAQMAALESKIEVLQVQATQRDEASTRKSDVDAAMKRLEGRPVGADRREKLEAFHEKWGPGPFQAHVDDLAQLFGVVPNADATGAAFTANAGTTPAVAMKYLEGGGSSADVDRAANFARQWDALQGSGLSVSLEDYVKQNMITPTEIEA